MGTSFFAVACLGGIGFVGVVICCGLGWLILSVAKDEAAVLGEKFIREAVIRPFFA